ncbi:MAG: cation:proton antiporter, partial [Dehalococcoidia bacterium]|nr:cation:proton antiporter [Dehalococcoidia bacterium]
LIGPYALGSMPIPGIGPLFPFVASGSGAAVTGATSGTLSFIAQIAIIILLFSAGLGTDFRQFVRFAGPASLVAIGGAAVSFAFGALATVLFGLANSATAPVALFIGAIISSTSVGIAARILKDIGKLGTPEGVTVLAADVLDDVVGILILTLVMGLVTAGTFHTSEVLFSLGKAVGFWLVFSAIAILVAKYIARFIISFQVVGAALALALALAFFSGGLAEQFGLATVIGAFSIGLALSNTKLASALAKPIDTVHHVFVPIFFVVMGMLVDFRAVGGVALFGLAVSALAILGKLLGCGLPSLGIGFNRWGAMRIGFGMVPRGEISLIIASVGLTRGIIPNEVFGVAVMVIMVTTIITAIVLSALFRIGGEGSRHT